MLGRGFVLGLSGEIASGKTTISGLLADHYNYVHLRSSNVLKTILLKNDMEINELNLQNIGKKMINEIGGAGLSELVLEDYNEHNNYVYDSIRHIEDLDYFYKRFKEKFIFFFIDAQENIRKNRYLLRDSRDNTLDSYIRRSSHPVESEIQLLKQNAEYVIINENLDTVIEKINFIITLKYKNL